MNIFSSQKLFRRAVNFCIAILAAGHCIGKSPAEEGGPADAKQLRVVATTGMIADLVRQIAGNRAEVVQLMGPGVDPHLYKPAASDTGALMRADVVFYNGLRLEGRMESVFEKLLRGGKRAVAVTDSIPRERLLAHPDIPEHYDPHVWFDVSLWALTVPEIARALGVADPEGAEYYTKRAAELEKKLADLHSWCLREVAKLPEDRRILITSHDAYGYFGRAYGFKVVGLQGVSTVSETSLADMASLVDFIRSHRVPAIFVETSVNPRGVQRVAEDAGVRLGGEIFSDATGGLGEMRDGIDTGTYEGMVRHNLNTILAGLSGAEPGKEEVP